jgi:hypothetical protein
MCAPTIATPRCYGLEWHLAAESNRPSVGLPRRTGFEDFRRNRLPAGQRLASNVDLAGHPRTVFRRALEHGNLLVAEATAREVGRITLDEALDLTLLIARKEPRQHPRVAARWLRRYLEEHPQVTIAEAAFAAGCLVALGGESHDEAARALRAMAERASSPGRTRRVA